MRAWNRRVEVDGEPIPNVACDVLHSLGLTANGVGVTPGCLALVERAERPAHLRLRTNLEQ